MWTVNDTRIYFNMVLKHALQSFTKSSNPPPARIIVFRDGLSDSQFEEIGRKEIGIIDSALWESLDRIVTLTVPCSRGPLPKQSFMVGTAVTTSSSHICCSWQAVCCDYHCRSGLRAQHKIFCRHHIRFFPIDGR
jgi:hypothetical protein